MKKIFILMMLVANAMVDSCMAIIIELQYRINRKLVYLVVIIMLVACNKEAAVPMDPRYVLVEQKQLQGPDALITVRGIDAPFLDTKTIRYNTTFGIARDTMRMSYLTYLKPSL